MEPRRRLQHKKVIHLQGGVYCTCQRKSNPDGEICATKNIYNNHSCIT